jgi:hypothetical protein
MFLNFVKINSEESSMVEVNNKLSKMTELVAYCHHAKSHDFGEVTEWVNGEGFDILLNSSRGEQRISVTYGEWEAIQVLAAYKEKK